MKDLDFDELDRAVASALGGSATSETSGTSAPPPSPASSGEPALAGAPNAAPATPVAPSISAHAVHSRIMPSAVQPRTTLARKSVEPLGTDAAPKPVSATQESSAPATQQLSKRRIPHREGKFMDVVRPGQAAPVSSKPTTAPVLKQPSSHEEAVTQPVEEPEAVSPSPAGASTNTSLEAAINELFVNEGHSPVVSDNTAEESALEQSTPDIVTEVPVVAPEEAPVAHPEASTVDTIPPAEDESVAAIAAELGAGTDETPPLLASPFLSDAKVEKRPLGGVSDATDISVTPASEAPDTTPAETPSALEPEPEHAPMPEELASDLLAIESSSPTPESPAPALESVAAAPAGPASIARQYKEQPRTASEDDESGAIFDPGTYQQPIEHPAKKSSGWGWIIAIIVIILLAVGGAVAAWFGGLLPVAL